MFLRLEWCDACVNLKNKSAWRRIDLFFGRFFDKNLRVSAYNSQNRFFSKFRHGKLGFFFFIFSSSRFFGCFFDKNQRFFFAYNSQSRFFFKVSPWKTWLFLEISNLSKCLPLVVWFGLCARNSPLRWPQTSLEFYLNLFGCNQISSSAKKGFWS